MGSHLGAILKRTERIDTVRLSLGVWNVGNKGDRVKERINGIQQTLSHIRDHHGSNLDILLVQEAKSGPIFRSLAGNHTSKPENQDNFVIVKKTSREDIKHVKNITLEDKNKIIPKTRISSERQIRLLSKLKRMDASVVEIGARLKQKCLLVSWHGEQSGITHEDKKEILHDIVMFLRELQQANKCDLCMMGGDYNLDIEKAAEVCSVLNIDVHRYIKSTLRARKGTIDFLVSWPKGKVTVADVKAVDFVPDSHLDAFDHQLVWYNIVVDLRPGKKHFVGDIDELSDRVAVVEEEMKVVKWFMKCSGVSEPSSTSRPITINTDSEIDDETETTGSKCDAGVPRYNTKTSLINIKNKSYKTHKRSLSDVETHGKEHGTMFSDYKAKPNKKQKLREKTCYY